jgi:putative endonuclease
MLRCSDDSYYVGSTSYPDIAMRVSEHNDAKYGGYTASRRPVFLVWAKCFDDLHEAHATERRLKGWSRAKKLALIADDETELRTLSVRRSGRPVQPLASLTKRQLAVLAQSAGAYKEPAYPLALARKTGLSLRTGGSDIASIKLAHSRHPEVRPGAKRRGAPKDE